MLARFFIDRPIFAWVVSLVILLGGGVAALPPHRALPQHHAPHGAGDGAIPGQRGGGGRHRGGPHRAAGQRRRAHVVHVVAVHQRRQLHADGHVRDRHRREHRPGAGPEPRHPGLAPVAPASAARGRERRKPRPTSCWSINLLSPDRRYDSVYMSNFATIQIKDELLRIKGVGDIIMSGSARLQHASVARPGQDGHAQPDGLGCRHRHPEPKRPGGGRGCRPATGARGSAIPADHERPGPARHGKAIRRHHCQDRRLQLVEDQLLRRLNERALQPGRVRPRHRPGRAGRPDIRSDRPAGRQALRRAWRSSCCRAPTPWRWRTPSRRR